VIAIENTSKAVYAVSDIQQLLGIGKNQAYALVKSEQFPVRKVGATYLIPKAGFDKWLNGDISSELLIPRQAILELCKC
jgi:excisionase family DNA binding protein